MLKRGKELGKKRTRARNLKKEMSKNTGIYT